VKLAKAEYEYQKGLIGKWDGCPWDMPDRSDLDQMRDELLVKVDELKAASIAKVKAPLKKGAESPLRTEESVRVIPDSWEDEDDGLLDFFQGAMHVCHHVVHVAPTAAYVHKIDYPSHAIMVSSTASEMAELMSLPTKGKRSRVGFVDVCVHNVADCQCVRKDKDIVASEVTHKTDVAWVFHDPATPDHFRRVNRGDVVVTLADGPDRVVRKDGVVFTSVRPRGSALPHGAKLYVPCDIPIARDSIPPPVIPATRPEEMRAEQLALRIPLEASTAQKTKALIESAHSLSRAYDMSIVDARSLIATVFRRVRSEVLRCRGLATDDNVYMEALFAEPTIEPNSTIVKTSRCVWLNLLLCFFMTVCVTASVYVLEYDERVVLAVGITTFLINMCFWCYQKYVGGWDYVEEVVSETLQKRNEVVDEMARLAVGSFSDCPRDTRVQQ
jgi:hypothetical protein